MSGDDNTSRLHFQIRDDKDQRKTQTQTFPVNGPLQLACSLQDHFMARNFSHLAPIFHILYDYVIVSSHM